MVKIKDFHRANIFKSDYGTKTLLDNIFRRIFFDYQGKLSLGWAGLSSSEAGYWLFKFKNRPGIYGLSYRGNLRGTNFWRNDIYDLQYFPDINEEICDFFSIKENISILDPNFETKIRKFQDHQEFEQLFHTGRIIVSINNSENCLIFSLWAPERWMEILKEGLKLRDESGNIHEIVSRGGIDRNIPAFEISYFFFERLITTFCYQTQRHPSYVILKKRESMAVEINSLGEINPSETTTTFENLISICFDDNHKNRISNTLRKFFPIFEFEPKENTQIVQIIREYTDKAIFNGINPLWWNINNLRKEEKVPAILFTGFLGSGKTTLINQIVEYEVLNKNKFIAVIQNEAGQKGIDGKLIDSAYTVETLDDGCICCGIRDKFVNSVIEICNIYKPDMLLIETSGMAEPYSIINDLLGISKIRLDSVITLIDCLNFDAIMKDFKEIAVSQIENANILVLTKLDKINNETYLRIKKFLNNVNPKALLIESSKEISISLLMSLPISFDLDSLKQVNKECSRIHSKFFKVLSINIKKELSYESLHDFLIEYSEKFFRIKGIVKLKEFEKPQVLQSVGGNFELTNYHESIEEGILIFIGKNFSDAEIKRFFKSDMIPLNFYRRT